MKPEIHRGKAPTIVIVLFRQLQQEDSTLPTGSHHQSDQEGQGQCFC